MLPLALWAGLGLVQTSSEEETSPFRVPSFVTTWDQGLGVGLSFCGLDVSLA